MNVYNITKGGGDNNRTLEKETSPADRSINPGGRLIILQPETSIQTDIYRDIQRYTEIYRDTELYTSMSEKDEKRERHRRRVKERHIK